MTTQTRFQRCSGSRASAALFASVVTAAVGATTYGFVSAAASYPAPPLPTITSAPPSPSGSTSATFTFTDTGAAADPDNNHDSDPVKFQCALNGSKFSGCTSPRTYTGLQDGHTYTFSVRAGQEKTAASAAATYSWSVSTRPPSIALKFPRQGGDYDSAGWNSGCNPPGYCGSAKDVAGVRQVQLSIQQASTARYWNGSAFSGSSQSFVTATLASPNASSTTWAYGFTSAGFPADGTYTVSVRATDTLGHQTAAAGDVTATFVIDRTPPPAPALTGAPSNPSTSTSATFTYTDSESGVSFRCSLDGSSYKACASGGQTYSGLSQGSHTFKVVACDAAGNCSGATRFTWTINAGGFAISGSPSGSFYPGGTPLRIDAVITNPFGSTLTVTSLAVTVAGTSAPGCAASNFTVVQNLVGAVDIPANASESLSAAGVPPSSWPAVQMVETHTNQDACRGATVKLTYAGSGNHN
jgi:hypothetical protein